MRSALLGGLFLVGLASLVFYLGIWWWLASESIKLNHQYNIFNFIWKDTGETDMQRLNRRWREGFIAWIIVMVPVVVMIWILLHVPARQGG